MYPKKKKGQIFTPQYIVCLMLDEAGYSGVSILCKHIIDNSCGDGAFLCEIIRRYVKAYYEEHQTMQGVQEEIKCYIHGIENNKDIFDSCIEKLKQTCNELGFDCDYFDVICDDALKVNDFDNKMDFVVGNPPYVRVHDIEDIEVVKNFSFANGGMTDMFLVFFEISFKMLKLGGKLCYITPSSWLYSVAGSNMRQFLRENNYLLSLIDFGHYQAFSATTYSLISTFIKGMDFKMIQYNIFDPEFKTKQFIGNISMEVVDINGNFYIGETRTLKQLKEILTTEQEKFVTVKNGFATLSDNVFIRDKFPFDTYTIPVVKASTNKWYTAFFPYETNGKPVDKLLLFSNDLVAGYLNDNKEALLKGKTEEESPNWYLYGRSQAIKDVFVDKLTINNTIKDVKSVKTHFVTRGSGIYSGFYIISNFPLMIIRRLLKSQDFVNYVASLKKYKSGGYYTFNTKDLEAYLNYKIQNWMKENKGKILAR